MQNQERILNVLKRNEEIHRKFFEVETEILTILDFGSFFERLVELIKSKFQVHDCWITLLLDSAPTFLLENIAGLIEKGEHVVLIEQEKIAGCLLQCHGPLLLNKNLQNFSCILPESVSALPQSMAFAPLKLDGHVVGYLTQADPNQKRFSPEMDATLLAQLAVKASLCLSNVTAHERLARVAARDPLTGLLNRRVLESRLAEEFERAVRFTSLLGVVFIDMDDFKQVNDSLGHDAGDVLLSFFAERLRKMARKIDVCARFAGDEFVLLLPNTNYEQAATFMQRVENFFAIQPVPGIERYVQFSYGIACSADARATSPRKLLKLADLALYTNKSSKVSHRSKKLSV